MTSYLVHLPAGARPGSAEGLDRAVLVKDGFHWVALVLPLLWLLFNRLWLAFLGLLAVGLLLAAGGILLGLPEPITIGVELLLALTVALAASDLKSRALARRGLPLADVVVARTEEEALQRFADRWVTGAAEAARPATPGSTPARGGSAMPVLGLFPEAGRT